MTIRTEDERQSALARLDEMTKAMRSRSFDEAEAAEFTALTDALLAYRAAHPTEGSKGTLS